MKKIIIFLSVAVGLTLLALSCSDDNGQNAVQAGTPAIHNISPALGPAGTKITITGENFSSFSNNSVKIGGVAATVTSASDTELVVVVPAGVNSGTLDVTLNGDSDIKGSFTATGKDLEGQLLLNHSELTLYPYPHYAKTLEVIYSDSGNHEEEDILWESSDVNVATVDQNGRVTPLALGTTTITATIGGGANGESGTCEVSVVDGPVTKLLLDETKLNLYSGDQAQIGIATLKADVQETGLPVWSSDNDEVATVDQQGLVTAIQSGTANITVTVDNASASCAVTVLPSVYVAGYQSNGNVRIATIWKNGVPQVLSLGNSDSEARSVFVDGTDVYVAGWERVNGITKAQLWVNGTATNPDQGQNTSRAFCVFKHGNDIYLAGGHFPGNFQVARLWVNGNGIDYSDGSSHVSLTSVFVDGQDIYASGMRLIGNTEAASIRVNEVRTDLTDGTENADAWSIFADGNDLYVASQETINNAEHARLWTNGVPTSLQSQTGGAKSVVKANGNVYVAGFEWVDGKMNATVWINGVPNHLQGVDFRNWGYSVFVDGSDVYVAGNGIDQGISIPLVWKNGSLMHLDYDENHDASIDGTSAIFVH